MDKYKTILTGLTILVGLFVTLAIFSSVVGVGLLQGFLILMSFILLLVIFIGGIAVLGAENFWWNYFKPIAAIPISWGLLHLAFVFMMPDVPEKIWALHWKLIIVIELAVIVLCLFLNKRTTFEERTSRKLLTAQYVNFFITAGLMISCRLFFGGYAADLNRNMLYRLTSSETELIAENIEKFDKSQKAKYPLAELNRLSQESKKRSLSKLELQSAERLKARIQEIYTVPESKKIKNLWPFSKSAEARIEPSLAGTFKMPAAAIQNLDRSWRVPVLADKLVVNSTLQVKKGQGVIITATGQANGCKNRYDTAYGWIGPEGRKWSWNKNRRRPLGQNAPFMALCAKIGESGKWFKVGRKISFRAPQDGKIYFTVNDDTHDRSGRFRPGWRKDNEGRFIVKVKIDC